ncbi:hypothetical protein D3C76_783170 [compost metagenome]
MAGLFFDAPCQALGEIGTGCQGKGLANYFHPHAWVNDLDRLVAVLGKSGTQAFMALHQVFKAALQQVAIQCTLEPQGHADVVGSAQRLELPEKPLSPLGVRQADGAPFVAYLRDRQASEAHALGLHLFKKLLALLQWQMQEPFYQLDVLGRHFKHSPVLPGNHSTHRHPLRLQAPARPSSPRSPQAVRH